jgi:hypothetical protein
VQALGRAAEVELLRDREERFQFNPVHGTRLRDQSVRPIAAVRSSALMPGLGQAVMADKQGFPHDRKVVKARGNQ